MSVALGSFWLAIAHPPNFQYAQYAENTAKLRERSIQLGEVASNYTPSGRLMTLRRSAEFHCGQNADVLCEKATGRAGSNAGIDGASSSPLQSFEPAALLGNARLSGLAIPNHRLASASGNAPQKPVGIDRYRA
jgi:hypothetical protein